MIRECLIIIGIIYTVTASHCEKENNQTICTNADLQYVVANYHAARITHLELTSPPKTIILTKQALTPFPSLEVLTINKVVEDVAVDALENSPKLRELSLNENEELTTIPTMFISKTNVTKLWLPFNAYLIIPERKAFVESHQLTLLSLRACKITKIYFETFSKLPKLQSLYLSDNLLETLPEGAFSNNKNLKEITLFSNQFKQFSPFVFPRGNKQLPKSLHFRLENNKWECNCVLFPLMEWALQNLPEHHAPLLCSQPQWNQTWEDALLILEKDCSSNKPTIPIFAMG